MSEEKKKPTHKTKPLSKKAFDNAMKHNKGWANLRPLQKGEKINPTGKNALVRPKNTRAILKMIMDTCIPAGVLGPDFEKDLDKIRSLTNRPDLTVKEVILMSQAYKAMQGDTKAFTAVLDRLDGKAVQTTVNTDRSYEDYLKELTGESQPEEPIED
jgi:hypothetical protein